MHKLKTTFRTAVLYISSVVIIGGLPMSAFADLTDICKAASHYSARWEVDPQTNQCVEIYNSKGVFIGPEYMRPVPPTPSPTPTPDVVAPAGTTTVTDNGNGNATTSDNTNNGTSNTTDNNTVTVSNGIDSTANSGTADASGNQSQGSASTGDANTQATIVNNVNSVNGNNGVATFTYDIYGNVVGDININGNNGPVDVNNTNNLNVNTDVNSKTTLTNNANLNSTSGDANASGNESMGNATSGDANATVNLINLINTIIAANQSFIGTINIYGNLNGNIILSSGFIPQLIAANGGSLTSTNNLTSNTDINDNTGIVNNINLSAQSGDASVSGNESKGSATTGTAQTNLTVLNLTGHTVNASNSVLVFVNVLGTWVGMIMDAPGSTAAMIGGGVTENSTNNLTSNTNLNNNATITNNLNLSSVSGSAGVSGNESNGNATSGNATASANVANITSTTINLSDWMVILYINVYGKWIGDFLTNTKTGQTAALSTAAQQPPATPKTTNPVKSLGLTNSGSQNQFGIGSTASSNDNSSGSGITQAEVNAASKKLGVAAPSISPVSVEPRVDTFSPALLVTGFGIVGASGTWMLVRRRQEMRSAAVSF
jgi:hypothetical protein